MPFSYEELVDWLLSGDVSVAYQTHRDLLDDDREDLQSRIATEGWGAAFLSAHHSGGWGERFYQPKWISTHYTLLDLRNLGLPQDHPVARAEVDRVLREEIRPDGGIGPGKTPPASDVCVNGMFLDYASYFRADEAALRSIVDFLINEHMADGGFNCRSNRSGARHSSMHSTVSVLEGIATYLGEGYSYGADDLRRMQNDAREFLLMHHLFRSDRTGEIISPGFLVLSYPWRWKFNILRGLDAFRRLGAPWDERLADPMGALIEKQRPDGRWPMQAAHPGKVHFTMEKSRGPSRWNTLMALRVFRTYQSDMPQETGAS